jgi:hypothetical protein
MRYVHAAILILAIGAPAASALPSSVGSAGVSKAEGVVLVAKRGKTQAKGKGGKSRAASGAGGIHPLVGSGDY